MATSDMARMGNALWGTWKTWRLLKSLRREASIRSWMDAERGASCIHVMEPGMPYMVRTGNSRPWLPVGAGRLSSLMQGDPSLVWRYVTTVWQEPGVVRLRFLLMDSRESKESSPWGMSTKVSTIRNGKVTGGAAISEGRMPVRRRAF